MFLQLSMIFVCKEFSLVLKFTIIMGLSKCFDRTLERRTRPALLNSKLFPALVFRFRLSVQAGRMIRGCIYSVELRHYT